MATLYINRLKTRRMIGFGRNAHQRGDRQSAGNVPIALASADKPVGKDDRPHCARYDIPSVDRLRPVIVGNREQDLIASRAPLNTNDVSVAAQLVRTEDRMRRV